MGVEGKELGWLWMGMGFVWGDENTTELDHGDVQSLEWRL